MRLWVLAAALAVHVLAQAPDAAVGRKIFESQCALCHGQTGGGGRGPALNRPKLDRAPDDTTSHGR
jgi:mono/diheme cytochrome c family protein